MSVAGAEDDDSLSQLGARVKVSPEPNSTVDEPALSPCENNWNAMPAAGPARCTVSRPVELSEAVVTPVPEVRDKSAVRRVSPLAPETSSRVTGVLDAPAKLMAAVPGLSVKVSL